MSEGYLKAINNFDSLFKIIVNSNPILLIWCFIFLMGILAIIINLVQLKRGERKGDEESRSKD